MNISLDGFKIFNNTTHNFTLKQRLLILIGRPLLQSTIITVNKEVDIVKSESIGYIHGLLTSKNERKYSVMAGGELKPTKNKTI